MLVFPQLSTGTTGQFPLLRTKTRRTVINALADGRTVRYADGFGEVSWDLDLRELSSSERGAVEALFVASEGRLRSFTFLDPADNLLEQSEALTNAAWSKDPFLAATAGIGDPLGTQRATHLVNSGQANQGPLQRLSHRDHRVSVQAFRVCRQLHRKEGGQPHRHRRNSVRPVAAAVDRRNQGILPSVTPFPRLPVVTTPEASHHDRVATDKPCQQPNSAS